MNLSLRERYIDEYNFEKIVYKKYYHIILFYIIYTFLYLY